MAKSTIAKTGIKKQGTYRGHRERQQKRILDAAFELFSDSGIDRTTMSEIIGASELRASTVYEYFSNKDEIVWAIFSHVLEEDTARAKDSVESAGNGLGKITALLQFMADELTHRQPKIRFMAQFDAMYARDWPVERLLTVEGRFSGDRFEVFRVLIREGIEDGSLRSDLDPDLTLHAVFNAVIGVQRRFASLGVKVEREFGQPIDRLFQETIRIILLGLRRDLPKPIHATTSSKRPETRSKQASRKKLK
ncbi:TetR/AcrR family transcriptional regulator [Granulicella arctica]|uniref:TetR/AcrR family transcriptional regulator n=1 Tax=Granulicella arctica TaxID=940613 RepID=UPI0021DF64D7|nr:TetR/AcrR family transcriptional regulator [Granulicella arctica]